jgi:BirA family biotin operon repressor/biotin-[acetyl-CoA-carboxylase] ligase
VIHRFETIDSTMFEATRLANSGCPSGTVVVAQEQTAGHGRFGRSWHSRNGDGLYMSIVLRLGLPAAGLPVTTLALGLAAAEAIRETSGVECDLRWPNDVLIGEKKCAGILTELHGDAVVAGFGVNVNHAAFPEELAGIATSLRLATGREYSLEDVLQALLDRIHYGTTILLVEGRAAVLEMFTAASSYVKGKRVVVELPEGEVEGVTDGLDDSGFLMLRRDNGLRTVILAGGVRPARTPCS